MDLSHFSEDDFEPTVWVRDVLNKCSSEDVESHAAIILAKLEKEIELVNLNIDTTVREMVDTIPEVLVRTKALRDEVQLLKDQMIIVHQDINAIENDTGESLKEIDRLDDLKKGLSISQQEIQESDNWSKLVNEMQDCFDNGNTHKISKKINDLQISLKLLKKFPKYEDKHKQLETFKNRLEALLAPNILKCFSSNDTNEAATLVNIFSSMDRQDKLVCYYEKSQCEQLLKDWAQQRETDADGGTLQWMRNFYDCILCHWRKQHKYFGHVFTDFDDFTLSKSLFKVYTQIFDSLSLKFSTGIDELLTREDDKFTLLMEIRQLTEKFIERLFKLVEDFTSENSSGWKNLRTAIYMYFANCIVKYGSYEKDWVLQEWHKIIGQQKRDSDLSEYIQGSLSLCIQSVFDLTRKAMQRCSRLTSNCGFTGMLSAFRELFSAARDEIGVCHRRINQTHLEWSNKLHSYMTLLQICGEFMHGIKLLDQELCDILKEQHEEISKQQHWLLNEDGRKDMKSLLRYSAQNISELNLLEHSRTAFERSCKELHQSMYDNVLLASIRSYLSALGTYYVQSESTSHHIDLPDYSYSPLEYITQIGNFLITLPQHLEPFLFHGNPPLESALQIAHVQYRTASISETAEICDDGGIAHKLLEIVATGACHEYADSIIKLHGIGEDGVKQLIQDIGYLNNVLQDFGIKLNDALDQILKLLKLPCGQYSVLAQESGCSARYVAAIRQLRNIM